MNRLAKILLTTIGAAIFIAAPCFAAIEDCVGESHKYPNLSISENGSAPEGYPVRCQQIQQEIAPGEYDYVTIYAKSAPDCAQSGAIAANPDLCNPDPEPTSPPQNIIDPTTPKENPVTPTTGTTTKKDDETNIILIVSLIANGIFFIAIVVLLIILSKKSKALAVDETIIASTQVIYPHNSQKPFSPDTPSQPNRPNNHF